MSTRPSILMIIALLPLGCGGSTGTLSGTVSYKGKLLSQGTVTVYAENGTTAESPISPDGTYVIENCPGGKVKIAVSSPDPAQGKASAAALKASGRLPAGAPEIPPPSGDATKWFSIPANYANPDESGLTVEVSGSTEHAIDLK